MTEIIFSYKGILTIIQSDQEEKMKDIFKKYTQKLEKDINSLYFVYSGNIILNDELNFEMIANKDDKLRNKMNIVVNDKNYSELNSPIKKSKDIICPKCFENIKINIEDYNVFLYDCKNAHEIENISLNEFEETQKVDISKIKCNICKETNKNETSNNIFYRCNSCQKNLCPICKYSHDKTHYIINYNQKNYICEKHNEIFTLYCKVCKNNICMYCENEHNNHDIISFGKMMPTKEKLGNYKEKLKKTIDKFKRDIEEMINILNKTMENIQHYYNIIYDIININNDSNRKVNYEILYNISKIYDNNILEDLNDIINDDNINNKFKKIKNIYDKMTIKHIKSLNIEYKINKNQNIIRIFGSKFVKNNKDKCKIIIEGKEYELTDEFNINNCNKINKSLQLKLKGIKNITNMSYMFKGSESLVSLPNISNMDTLNITNMSYLFFGCTSLKILPDISNWNTSNVTNMSYMFCGCSSLFYLPDISK